MGEKRAIESAAIYTRVSSDKQEIDGTSLETQLAACLAYAAERGYDVAGTYSDTWTGGEYRERPGLTDLRAALADADVVICYALDRLSRNQAHVAILVEELVDAGTRLELVTEDFEDSAVGRFILSARAFVAEVEREKIAERTSRGRRARAEAGKIMPGPKPLYGYRWNTDRTALEIEESEAVIVRRIFREALAGASLRAIGRGLEADGILSPAGSNTWWPSTVRRILTDRHYTGEAYALRWRYDDADGDKRNQRRLAEDEAVRLPAGTIPPLVDRATQEAVIERLEYNKRAAPRNNREPESSLLRAGFVWCAICHTPMNVSNTSNPPYGQYRCRAPLADKRLHYMAINRTGLDEEIWAQVRAFILGDTVIDHALDRMGAKNGNGSDEHTLQHIERALAAIDRQRDNLARSIAQTDDPDTSAVLLNQLDQLADRRRAVEAERAALMREVEAAELNRQVLDDLEAWRGTIAANLDSMTYQQRRQLLSTLKIKVWVWPEGERDPRWHITSDILPDIVFRTSAPALRLCRIAC